MQRLLFTLFFLASTLYAVDENLTLEDNAPTKENLELIQKKREEAKHQNLALEKIEEKLAKSVMHARYNNHQTYLEIEQHLKDINKEVEKKKKLRDKKAAAELSVKYKSLENQLDLLGDFSEEPFLELTKPNEIIEPPKVTSPFDIFGGFTYVKVLKNDKEEYAAKLKSLLTLIETLEAKDKYLHALQKVFGVEYKQDEMKSVQDELEHVMNSFDLASTTNKLYKQKLDDSILKTTNDIKEQIKKLLKIATIIIVILLFSFLLKYFVKKTISDNERYYMANKGINFSNLVLIGLVLLFSFLENATYLVTVLGFASAGIAIAMKDLFMSSLGWLVIVFGGSFHVGDRVKAYKEITLMLGISWIFHF